MTYQEYRDGVGPSSKGGAGAGSAPSKSATDYICYLRYALACAECNMQCYVEKKDYKTAVKWLRQAAKVPVNGVDVCITRHY